MGKKLIIAEKRTAGTEMASVLDDPIFASLGYKKLEPMGKSKGFLEGDLHIICWASGHLFREKMPNEINPEWGIFTPFKTKEEYKMPDLLKNIQKTPAEDKNKERQRKILKTLLARKDVVEVINACDADSEGEGIFSDIYNYLGGRARNLPILRFWNTGSYKSDVAVTKAMKNLLPANDPKYVNLLANKMARSNGDYCVGMKITKALCDLYNKQFYIGRVKGVCIGLVGDRDLEIANFVSKPYWTVSAFHENLELKNFFYVEEDSVDKNGNPIKTRNKEENYFVKSEADSCKMSVDRGGKLIVSEYQAKTVERVSPALPLSGSGFTSIMMEKHGASYKETTEILDYLRQEGFTTYPGTNGNYFASSEAKEVEEALSVACTYFKISLPFDPSSEVFNDKKASDQNHAPLSVTEKVPTAADIQKWQGEKLRLIKEGYEMIARHIISKFLPKNKIEIQSLVAKTSDNYLFYLNGQKVIFRGWMDFMDVSSPDTAFDIPGLAVGSEIPISMSKITEKATTVPKPHTIKSLLDTLLNVSKVFDGYIQDEADPVKIATLKKQKAQLKGAKGIGTDRTRETVINDLFRNNVYQKAKNGDISLSGFGKELYTVCPKEIRSVIFTSVWEQYFEDIRNGKLSYSAFMSNMDGYLMNKIIPKIIADIGKRVQPSEKKVTEKKQVNIPCPLCAAVVFESDKLYFCSKASSKKKGACKFFIFKDLTKTVDLKLSGESDLAMFLATSKSNPLKGKGNHLWYNPSLKYMSEISWSADCVADEHGVIETDKVFKNEKTFMYKNLMGVAATKEEARKLLNGETITITRTGKKGEYKAKVKISKKGGKIDAEFVKTPKFGEESSTD